MYPDLSYMLHDLFGTEPDNFFSIFQTYGMLLVCALLVAGLVVSREFKRFEKSGIMKPLIKERIEGAAPTIMSVLPNALIGFVIGYKLLYVFNHFAEFKNDAAGVILSKTGDWTGGIIFLLAYGAYSYWMAKKKQLKEPKTIKEKIWPHKTVGDIILIAGVSGVIGAKLFAIVESKEAIESFIQDPLGMLLSGSGLAIYGGLIFGFLAVFYYIRKKKYPVLNVMDAAGPAFMLAYGVGRLGCHLSGDGDWGIPSLNPKPSWWIFPDWTWAHSYTRNVIDEGVKMADCSWEHCMILDPPVFPTSIYEITLAVIFFLILWALRKRLKIPGLLFFIFLIFNGITRFIIEFIRVNDKYYPFGIELSQAQIIAIFISLAGIIGSIWFIVKGKRTRVDT